MIKAVCFNCGVEKSRAIMLCNSCHALPISREDRVISVCLSNDCLRQDNLVTAVRYMRQNERLPGFHRKVRVKAEQIVDSMPEDFQLSESFDFPESFFTDHFMIDD